MITQTQLKEAIQVYEAMRQLTRREKETRRAELQLRRAYQGVFRKQGRLFVREFAKLKPLFPRIAEANTTAVVNIIPMLNMVFNLTKGEAQDALEAGMWASMEAGANNVIRMVGASGYSFDLAFPQAVEYISTNGAARVVRIDETTKDVVRGIVTRAVEDGTSWGKVADQLIDQFEHFAQRPNYVVSWLNNRAELIAVTEIGNAYEQGSASMADRLTQAGLDMEKAWEGPNDNRTSVACRMNIEAGWIPIADTFPSGKMQPLNHPGCRHTALYRRIQTPWVPAQPQVNQAEQARLSILEESQKIDEAANKLIAQMQSNQRKLKEMAETNAPLEEYEKLREETKKITAKAQRLLDSKVKKSRRHLYVDDPSSVDFYRHSPDGKRTAFDKSDARAAVAEFNKLVSDSIEKPSSFWIADLPKGSRAYYKNTETLYIEIPDGKRSRIDSIIHELGHWLEHQNEDVRKKVHGFYDRRTAGVNPTPMGGWYNNNEMTRDGGFFNPYVGYIYENRKGERYATEVLSMGIESFYKNPEKLARKDPDHFDFIYNLLRGQ